MIDNTVILTSLLGVLKLILLFYSVGVCFNFCISRKLHWGWFPTYFNFLSGMLLSVSLFAIVQTQGLTILLFIPLVLLLLSIAVHKQMIRDSTYTLRQKLAPFVFLLLSLIPYFFYYLQGFATHGDTLYYIYGDQEYYARIADNLNDIGIENMRVEYLFPHRFTVEPYHYGDLWTIALAAKLVPVKTVYITVLVTAPLLLSIVCLGMASLVSRLARDYSGVAILLVLLCGFIGGFALLFPKFAFPSLVDIYAHSLCNYNKLLWWASIFPLVLMLIAHKQDQWVLYPVFMIGMGYISVFPSLFAGTVIWISYVAFKRKVIPAYALRLLMISVLTVGHLYFLYSYYPSHQPGINRLSAKADIHPMSIFRNLDTSLNIFIGGGLQFLVYLPPFVLWLIARKKTPAAFANSALANVLLYCLVMAFIALCVWSLLFTASFEAVQFFYNVFVVTLGTVSVLVYVYVAAVSRHRVLQVAAVLLCVSAAWGNRKYDICVNSVTAKERNQLVQFIGRSPGKKIAHYRDPRDYAADIFGSSTVVAMPLSFLGYYIDRYENYSLNAPFAPLDSTRREYVFQKNNIAWSPMAHFIRLPENRGYTPDELMVRFIKKYRVGFLSAPVGVILPGSLHRLVSDSIIASGIGWKVYRLNDLK